MLLMIETGCFVAGHARMDRVLFEVVHRAAHSDSRKIVAGGMLFAHSFMDSQRFNGS